MNKTGISIDFGHISTKNDKTACLCHITIREDTLMNVTNIYYIHQAYEYNKKHKLKEDIQDTDHTFYCYVKRNKNDENNLEIAKKELLKKARKIAFQKVKRLYTQAAELMQKDSQGFVDLILNTSYNINKILLDKKI